MAAKSKLEKYKVEISSLIEKKVSIMSAWKILNSSFSEDKKISYHAFYHYVVLHIKQVR